jgi:preprotein translocase subunit SecG
MLFIVILIVVAAVLLVLVVLAQNSKGGGLSSQFGGSGASNLIGVKKTSDLLEKMTWGLAIAVLGLSMAFNVIVQTPQADENNSVNLDRAVEQQITVPSLEPVEGADNDSPQRSNDNSDSDEGLEGLTDEQ